MRTSGLPLLPLLALSIALSSAFACGGSTGTSGDDGGTPAGDGGAVTDAAVDGSTITDAAAIDASGKTCEEISKGIDLLRPKVRRCCAACRALQCTQTVDDLCCPISATTVDPEFVALVAEHKKRCGPTACPAVVCSPTPSNVCDPEPGSPNVGTCR